VNALDLIAFDTSEPLELYGERRMWIESRVKGDVRQDLAYAVGWNETVR